MADQIRNYLLTVKHLQEGPPEQRGFRNGLLQEAAPRLAAALAVAVEELPAHDPWCGVDDEDPCRRCLKETRIRAALTEEATL